jgi:hypothetical protein
MCPANSRPIARVRTGNLQDYEDCFLAAQEAWQVYKEAEKDDISKGMGHEIELKNLDKNEYFDVFIGTSAGFLWCFSTNLL